MRASHLDDYLSIIRCKRTFPMEIVVFVLSPIEFQLVICLKLVAGLGLQLFRYKTTEENKLEMECIEKCMRSTKRKRHQYNQ